MAVKIISGRDWLDFEHWASEELNLFEFQLRLMTDAEKADRFARQNAQEFRLVVNDKGELVESGASSTSEPEPDDEEWKQLLDELDARDKREKAELLAFADKLGCSIYLAAYLRHLNDKLEIVADAFAGRSKSRQLPRKIKRRK